MTSIIVGGATTISNTGTLRIYNDSANAVDGTLGDWEFVDLADSHQFGFDEFGDPKQTTLVRRRN